MTGHGLLAASVVAALVAGSAVPTERGRTGCDTAASLPPSVPADSVDVRPAVVPPRPYLRTPPRLAMAGVTGDVLLEYDVDSTGVVDPCSIRIILAKRPEFAASASDFVSALHFTPGILDGIPVRTRLQQRISFWQTNGARGRHHIF